MPRIQTESHIERHLKDKDDTFSIGPRCPTSPGNAPTSLDLEIDISRDVSTFCAAIDKLTALIHDYHLKFLEMAKSLGISPEPTIYSLKENLPQIDALHFSITMDPTECDLILEKRLDTFKKIAMERVRKHRDVLRARGQLSGYKKDKPHYGEWATNFFREVITDKRGILKTANDLKKELDLALASYSSYSNSHLASAVDIGFVKDTKNDKNSHAGDEKARIYYKRAENLVVAAAEGRFLEELKKPLREMRKTPQQ